MWKYFQNTVSPKELKLWENGHTSPRVTCHMSRFACHMSHFTCHIIFFLLFFKLVELIDGGFVINQAYPVLFYKTLFPVKVLVVPLTKVAFKIWVCNTYWLLAGHKRLINNLRKRVTHWHIKVLADFLYYFATTFSRTQGVHACSQGPLVFQACTAKKGSWIPGSQPFPMSAFDLIPTLRTRPEDQLSADIHYNKAGNKMPQELVLYLVWLWFFFKSSTFGYAQQLWATLNHSQSGYGVVL